MCTEVPAEIKIFPYVESIFMIPPTETFSEGHYTRFHCTENLNNVANQQRKNILTQRAKNSVILHKSLASDDSRYSSAV
jgi:hypothetical protein